MHRNPRIDQHPILGPQAPGVPVTIYYNGSPVSARQGDSIAAALLAAGVRVFRHTHRKGEARGVFCAIGQCTDCAMTVDGVPGTKVCMAYVREGLRVEGT